MKCPVCKTETFVAGNYEGVEIDRCSQCHGNWLDEGELWRIVATREKVFTPAQITETMNASFGGIPAEERKHERACPKCDARLLPFNYAEKSGVILDRCPKGHGIWLDATELEKVQIFFEHEDEIRNFVQDTQKAAAKNTAPFVPPPRSKLTGFIRKLFRAY